MPMKHFKNAQKMNVKSLNIPDINAYLTDIVSSGDAAKPITCGLFRMEKGKALDYTYSYDEVKIMPEGEMTLQDETGAHAEVKPGDVLYFSKGTKINFSSKSKGLAFYCGQRKEGEL
jgi:ethanolamine utilization protein EutQ (cupin superfamily)